MYASVSLNTKYLNAKLLIATLCIGIALLSIFVSKILLTTHLSNELLKVELNDLGILAEEIYSTGEITETVKNLPLDAALIEKMSQEITRKLAKSIDYPDCEVYFLEAAQSGLYPILGYGDVITGYVELKIGDIWKVGITGNGEKGRYSGNTFYKNKEGSFSITNKQLIYRVVYKGTYKQMIVTEKLLIYTYSLWSGHSDLLKPPGCKIFR